MLKATVACDAQMICVSLYSRLLKFSVHRKKTSILLLFCIYYSALSDSFRNYFLNGDYVITNPAKHKVAGTVFTYERTQSGQERIFSLGPTAVPVHVEVRAKHIPSRVISIYSRLLKIALCIVNVMFVCLLMLCLCV